MGVFKLKKLITLLTVSFTTLILASCGGGGSDSDLVKERMKVVNTYGEDMSNPGFDEKLQENMLERMSEEELAEFQVEVDLGLRSDLTGKYDEYGVKDDEKPYVKRSIERGLSIPTEGKVLQIVNEEDSEREKQNEDDLGNLLAKQGERLERMNVKTGSDGEVKSEELNRRILSALKEERTNIEDELEQRKEELEKDNGNDLIEQEIRTLEAELKRIRADERIDDEDVEGELDASLEEGTEELEDSEE